jgi:hypothetical protein
MSGRVSALEDNMNPMRFVDPEAEDEKRLARFREAWTELKKNG